MSQILAGLPIVPLNEQDVSDSMALQERRRRKVLRENHPAIVEHSFVCWPVTVNSRIVKKEYRRSIILQRQGSYLGSRRAERTNEITHVDHAYIP